jgi:MraZ protein
VGENGSAGAPGGGTPADGAALPPAAPLPPLFLGTHEPRLDDKGRLFLPARFRDDLSAGVVITRGQERCLYVFPAAEFRAIYAQLRQAPVTNRPAREYVRLFLSLASDSTPDKQGRVTVPPKLREYAGLTHDCVVVGAGARLEVWDAPTWEAYVAEHEESFADQSEEVLPGIF